jgi:hypothetical protein
MDSLMADVKDHTRLTGGKRQGTRQRHRHLHESVGEEDLEFSHLFTEVLCFAQRAVYRRHG